MCYICIRVYVLLFVRLQNLYYRCHFYWDPSREQRCMTYCAFHLSPNGSVNYALHGFLLLRANRILVLIQLKFLGFLVFHTWCKGDQVEKMNVSKIAYLCVSNIETLCKRLFLVFLSFFKLIFVKITKNKIPNSFEKPFFVKI